MTHDELKQARQTLGLSLSELALMLDTDKKSVQRMEMSPDHSTAKPPAPRMVRLMQAYLSGYRPDDWPAN